MASSGAESGEGIIQSISLVGVTRGLVKRLPGFDKTRHTVPKWGGDRAQQFVGMIAEPELREWAEGLFADMRTAMSYKRKDISLDFGIGEALLVSRDFTLKRRYLLDEEDLDEFEIETELMDASSVELLEYSNFNDAIGPLFDQLRCLYRREQPVEELIDAIEDAEKEGLMVDYPSSCDTCDVRIGKSDALFVFDAISVTVKLPRFCSPGELMNAVNELGDILGEEEELLRRLPISLRNS